MPTLQKIMPILLSLLLVACQPTEIISELDSSVDFSLYHTFSVCLDDFQIRSDEHPEYNNEKMKDYIKEAMETEMKKYYAPNDSIPELRAGVKIIIEDKQLSYRSCDHQDDYRLWKGCSLKTNEYTEGTFLIYVADVAKNQVIWQASFSGIADGAAIENKRIIERTVKSLYQEFPMCQKKASSL